MLICLSTHKSYQNYHLIAIELLFIHKTIGCVHQTDQEREQGIQLPVLYTLSDHMVSGRFGAMSRMEVFLYQV